MIDCRSPGDTCLSPLRILLQVKATTLASPRL
nr:MAG TPA: hypothetical protein [Caudoviricetes sp.]